MGNRARSSALLRPAEVLLPTPFEFGPQRAALNPPRYRLLSFCLHEERSDMRLKILVAVVLGVLLVPAGTDAAPIAGANVLVDQDHGLQFPQNKQNENTIVRD